MKIGVIIAMDKEFQRIKDLLAGVHETEAGGRLFVTGHMGANEVVLHQCGIGKVNAAIGVSELIRRFRPELVVSTGCAGGASTALEVQDVVVSTELAYHDVYCGEAIGHTEFGQVQGMPARYTSPKDLVDKALALNQTGCGCHVKAGLIVTGDWFVDSKEKMQTIIEHFPEALAVDMESAAIAQTCHVAGVPFISFRVISDIPLKDTNASQYHDFWASVAEHSFQATSHFLRAIAPTPSASSGQGDENTETVGGRVFKKIPSFTIDHTKLMPGIYVSRKDQVGGDTVTTFDIRMKAPNREPAVHPGALHTIEHLAATFLRNDEEWKDRIIYWGPMGCLTGNYLLVRGDYEAADIHDLICRTFDFIAHFEGHIPGASPKDCGNWLLNDLPMARWEAERYLGKLRIKNEE